MPVRQTPVFVVLHATGITEALPELYPPRVPRGFHYLIDGQGVLHQQLGENEEGSHTKGKNTGSIGVMLMGRRNFAPAQMDTLFSLYFGLRSRWGIEVKTWYACHEFDRRIPEYVSIETLRDRLISL